MSDMRRCFFLPMLLAAAASGCMMGPDYSRPDVETGAAFRFEDAAARETAGTAWWKQFDDPVLDTLIDTALRENKDLRSAAARVEEFEGRLTTARSPLFPQLGYSASYSRLSIPLGGSSPLPSGLPNPRDSFEGVVTANWEIDIWGRIRRLTEAARADLIATEEGRRAVLLTLVTAVANGYIDLRTLDQQLEISRASAASYLDTFKLFELRFSGGLVSEVEVEQIRSQYENANARIPFYEKLVAQQEHALSVLLGQNPGPIPRGKSIDELGFPAVPAGLPSQLLERRPDLVAAEQQLVAANARIGAAKALYFPTISLTGTFGSASSDLSSLFSGPNLLWNYAGKIVGPIFTAGAISGTVDQAEARQKQALANYEQAIQSAFREVEDALVDQQKSRARLEAQGRQVEAFRRYAQLARIRFDNGYTSYLEPLDAERNLFDAQLSQAETRAGLFKALVNVYKAMGGGWVAAADHMAAESPATPEAEE